MATQFLLSKKINLVNIILIIINNNYYFLSFLPFSADRQLFLRNFSKDTRTKESQKTIVTVV